MKSLECKKILKEDTLLCTNFFSLIPSFFIDTRLRIPLYMIHKWSQRRKRNVFSWCKESQGPRLNSRILTLKCYSYIRFFRQFLTIRKKNHRESVDKLTFLSRSRATCLCRVWNLVLNSCRFLMGDHGVYALFIC